MTISNTNQDVQEVQVVTEFQDVPRYEIAIDLWERAMKARFETPWLYDVLRNQALAAIALWQREIQDGMNALTVNV